MLERGKYKRFIIALLCTIVLAGSFDFASAKGIDQSQVNSEGGIQLPSVKVTIERKTLAAVITNIGDRYAVTDATIISDGNGQQVSIRKLLVPCEAVVSFSNEGGIRKAEVITILRIGNNATWHWISEKAD